MPWGGVRIEVREQLCGNLSLLPSLCGFWGLNSNHQASVVISPVLNLPLIAANLRPLEDILSK